MLVVINMIHWCVVVCAINCMVDGRTCWSRALQQSSIDSQLIRPESRFVATLPAFDAPFRVVSVGLLPLCLVWKNYNGAASRRWKTLKMFTLFDRHMDGRTDGRTPHDGICRACIASRGKNILIHPSEVLFSVPWVCLLFVCFYVCWHIYGKTVKMASWKIGND